MPKQTKFVTVIGDMWRYLSMIVDFIRGLIPLSEIETLRYEISHTDNEHVQ